MPRSESTPSPARSSTPPAVQVDHLVHGYVRGLAVVHDVSLTVAAGQVHCLLGSSGSGKTTLLRLIAGLERPWSGEIWIAGERVESLGVHRPPEQRRIGYVFQDYALFPHLTVAQNVMYGMTVAPRGARRQAALEWLARVDLADRADAMPHMLSGGQQQRVALVRALARGPAVMLLDEPFSGLDVELREKVRQETLALLQAAQVATVMVTHDPQEAYVAANIISVMQAGRIVTQGRPDEVCQVTTLPSGLAAVRVNPDAPKG